MTLKSLLTVGALIATTGCFQLARPTPPLEEYVLGGGTGSVRAATGRSAGGVTIGIRRIDLAPYLATTSIVVRHGSRIATSGFRRWGEEPGAGISRALAGYLGAAPSILAIDVAPWPVQAKHDYLIQLHISHMEGVTAEDSTAKEGEVHLIASWEILRAEDGALLARGESDHREVGWRVGEYRSLVAGVEKGLGSLATDLVACFARLTPAMPPPDAPPVSRPAACGLR
jgi:uncharacterized lipoprotein YmbA